jgi:dolichol-phosphate mannosyltransferase
MRAFNECSAAGGQRCVMPGLRTLLVLPTLDEGANIKAVLCRIRTALPDADTLVVDDGSNDGTPELADAVAAELGRIKVLRRTGPRGLGPAYRAGFGFGLAHGYDVLIEMDADLSHDPAALPALVAAVERGADLAIGSRYVPGGDTPGWPWHRRLLSRGGGWYARTLLGLQVRDVTSGYRAYRADLLRAVDLPSVTTTGYGFQIDLTDRANRAGAVIDEVPIVFRDRRAGESKMSGRIVREALLMVTRRAFRHWRPIEQPRPNDEPRPIEDRPPLVGRLARCMSVSAITTVISFTVIVLATAVFGLVAALANVIATSIATVPSYSLNRRWTWGRRDRSDVWREVVPFWVLAFLGLALSTVTVGIADSWAAHMHLTPGVHTATILAGNLGGYGLLWVLQFALLDTVLFRIRPDAAPVPVLEAPAGDHDATMIDYRSARRSVA